MTAKATKKKPTPTPTRQVPAPSTPEGELFHYTPEEAADWLPFTARVLREKAYRRVIDHNGGGGRISFTGLNIRAISAQYSVPAVADKRRTAAV